MKCPRWLESEWCGDANKLPGGCPGSRVCEEWTGPRPTEAGPKAKAKAVQGSLFAGLVPQEKP